MGVQDKTERVLRNIHVLLSESEAYDKATNKIIVDKKKMLSLLKDLNTSIYEMMEAYDLTKQSRDTAEREMRKKGNEIVLDASRKAEDVYAASVLYTDEALCRVQNIIEEAGSAVMELYEELNQKLLQEKEVVRRDQSELKGHLHDLKDTDKYFKLIEERNKEIAAGKAKAEKEPEPSPYAAIKPEIRINTEYFEKAGIPLEEEALDEWQEEKKEAVPVQVSVNLDAEYFKWKDEGKQAVPEEKKADKHTRLGKLRK